MAAIDLAVRTGAHGAEADGLAVDRTASPTQGYVTTSTYCGGLFDDVWQRNEPVYLGRRGRGLRRTARGRVAGWLRRAVASKGSSRCGRKRRLRARAGCSLRKTISVLLTRRCSSYRSWTCSRTCRTFRAFLADVRSVLLPGGEIFMETGNLADAEDRSEFADELGVPDHLVFAGERHIRGYLEESGLDVVRIERQRADGLVNSAKCVAKALLGRPTQLRIPYTSRYRQLLIRARLPG